MLLYGLEQYGVVMLITAFSILFFLAALLRSLRQGFYAAHVVSVLLTLIAYNMGDWQAGEPFTAHSLWAFALVHLLFINLWTFAAYAYDKNAAQKGKWRVPEKSLHSMAFLGGTPGAFIASRVFRHKTKKARFRAIFWLVTALQIALVVVLGTIARS